MPGELCAKHIKLRLAHRSNARHTSLCHDAAMLRGMQSLHHMLFVDLVMVVVNPMLGPSAVA